MRLIFQLSIWGTNRPEFTASSPEEAFFAVMDYLAAKRQERPWGLASAEVRCIGHFKGTEGVYHKPSVFLADVCFDGTEAAADAVEVRITARWPDFMEEVISHHGGRLTERRIRFDDGREGTETVDEHGHLIEVVITRNADGERCFEVYNHRSSLEDVGSRLVDLRGTWRLVDNQ